MSDCIFCHILSNQAESFLYEDEEIIVLKDINPKADTHLLVITKEHIESLAALTPEHGGVMGGLILKLPQLAQQFGLTSGFRTIVNTGPGGGQEVPHIHFHLLGGSELPSF